MSCCQHPVLLRATWPGCHQGTHLSPGDPPAGPPIPGRASNRAHTRWLRPRAGGWVSGTPGAWQVPPRGPQGPPRGRGGVGQGPRGCPQALGRGSPVGGPAPSVGPQVVCPTGSPSHVSSPSRGSPTAQPRARGRCGGDIAPEGGCDSGTGGVTVALGVAAPGSGLVPSPRPSDPAPAQAGAGGPGSP